MEENRIGRLRRLEGHAQRAAHRRLKRVGIDLTRALDGFAAQRAVQRHGGRGQPDASRVRTFDVGLLAVTCRFGQRDVVSLGYTPAGGALPRQSGEDPVINTIWCCFPDIHEAPVFAEQCGLHGSCGVSHPSTGNVDDRARLRDDGITRREADCSACHSQLPDIAFDQAEVSRDITERRADPGITVEHAGATQVDINRRTPHSSSALQGRVGQFRAAQLQRENAVTEGNIDCGRARNVDDRPGLQINLSARCRPACGEGRAAPLAGADRHTGLEATECVLARSISGSDRIEPIRDSGAGSEDRSVLADADGAALDVDQRGKR